MIVNTVGTKNSVCDGGKNQTADDGASEGCVSCSPPSPSPKAMGIIPMIIAVASLRTGRKRVNPACRAASKALSPASKRSRAKLMTSTLLAVATPMHMIAPVSAGTLDGGMGEKQHPYDTRQRAGQSRDDDEGVRAKTGS